MKPYKKTILICLLVAIGSSIGIYYVTEVSWNNIFSGIFTGAIMSIITTSVLYNVKKSEIFDEIGIEFLRTYDRLSYMYARLINCVNKLKNNEENRLIIYKEIVGIYQIYEKYTTESHMDAVFNNYDGLLFNNWITRFFVSKEIKVLVDIKEVHRINTQYVLLCNGLSIKRIELDIAERTGNIEQINNLIMQIDTQCNYSINAILQQLAFINYAMQHFEQIKKLANPWYVIKQDTLSRHGLFDCQINNAEHNLQEECKKSNKN